MLCVHLCANMCVLWRLQWEVFRAQAVFLLAVKGQEQCKKDCSRSEQYTKRLSLYMCVCVCGCENKSHPEEFVK